MGANLPRYVLPKVPIEHIKSVARCTVSLGESVDDLSAGPKSELKRANYLRPRFSVLDGESRCVVAPGGDYQWHYARLVATAALIVGTQLVVELDVSEELEAKRRNFVGEGVNQTVEVEPICIIGDTTSLVATRGEDTEWLTSGIRISRMGGCSVVECSYSFWGDLCGEIVALLATRGAEEIIYLGKLGALSAGLVPNRTLVTGNSSILPSGENVLWDSPLSAFAAASNTVQVVRHVTVPSVLDETLEWFERARLYSDVVDPEIGRAASVANLVGVRFSYLHIVTDHLGGDYRDGLYGERHPSVLQSRNSVRQVRDNILLDYLGEV